MNLVSISSFEDLERLLELARKYRLKHVKIGDFELQVDTFVAAAEMETAGSLDDRVQQRVQLEDRLKEDQEDLLWSTGK